MPRKPMVTRTFRAVDCRVLCLDIETKETSEQEITVYGHYRSDAQIRDAARRQVETDTLRVVSVSLGDTYEQLLAMDEPEFIKLAHKIPPRPIY